LPKHAHICDVIIAGGLMSCNVLYQPALRSPLEEAARNWNYTRTDVFSCSRFVNKKIIGLNIEQVL